MRDEYTTEVALEDGRRVRFTDLRAWEKVRGGALEELPAVVKILLESVVRNLGNDGYRTEHAEALARWQPDSAERAPEVEIPYLPARVLLQDLTGVPCVVDLASLRSAVVTAGGEASWVEPRIPVDMVVDHSVQVDCAGSREALAKNMEIEFRRNRERYEFLRWGQGTFQKLRIVSPGVGICHQVNLEYLARAVQTEELPDGSLLVCADHRTELWEVQPNGDRKVIASRFEDKAFNGPNDVWACPQGGGCYFTDPFYKRSWWQYDTPPQGSRQVYYLPKGGKPVRVTTDLVQPNGIVGTPDGKTLYVADIDAKKVYVYAIQPDGTLADRRVFCGEASDGMTIDADGRVYLANQNVSVYSPKGEKLGVIEIPEGWCGNLCIGGPGKDTLFVTASKGFYAVPLKVKGSKQGK